MAAESDRLIPMSNAYDIQPVQTTSRDDIAAAVRAHIAVRGLKDTQVARTIGKSQSWMSRRTNGDTPLDSDDLGLIASAFGITYVELVQMPTGRPSAPHEGRQTSD